MPWKSFFCLLVNGWGLEKPFAFRKPKGNNSYIAQEIMTKLHVHYSIVTYNHNNIHEIWSIANLNRGNIDPTNCLLTVSDPNRPTIDQQSADFVNDFCCFLGSVGGQKVITDHFFYRPTVFGTWQRFRVDGPSVDYWSTVDLHSAIFCF